MLINKIGQPILVASLLCLSLCGFNANAWIVSPDYHKRKESQKTDGPLLSESHLDNTVQGSEGQSGTTDEAASVRIGLVEVSDFESSPDKPVSSQNSMTFSSITSPEDKPIVKRQKNTTSALNDITPTTVINNQQVGNTTIVPNKLSGQAQKVAGQSTIDNSIYNPNKDINESGQQAQEPESLNLPQLNNRGPVATTSQFEGDRTRQEGVLEEQQALDQGLIEAQINDVLDSAEFLQLEREVAQSQPKIEVKSETTSVDPLTGITVPSEPEDLLNQLDESDLMDYVAEDDLWKEQLTIEDEP